MPYIGHGVTNAGTFYVIDDLTMSSSTTYTLQVGGVSVTPKADNLLITLDGVVQHTPDAYTVSGSTLTFASAPGSGVDFYGIIMGQSASTGQGSIGADELKVTGDGSANQFLAGDGDGTFTFKDGTLSTTTTTGDIIYRANSSALARLGIGSTGQVLTVANGVPAWSTDTEAYLPSAGGTMSGNIAMGGGDISGGGTITGTFVGGITGNVTGNADTATALATARAINGVDFDGSAAITVTAAAGTLSGTELKSTVVTSSLTSVGTLTSLGISGAVTSTGEKLQITHATPWVCLVDSDTSNSGAIEQSGTNLYLSTSSSTGNIYFKNNNSNSGRPSVNGDTLLTISDGGNATFAGRVAINDTINTYNMLAIETTTTDAYTPASFNDNSLLGLKSVNATNSYSGIQFTNSAGNYEKFIGSVQTGSNTADIVFQGYDRGAGAYKEYVRIQEDGNVGIGTAAPATRLALYGDDGVNTGMFEIWTKQVNTSAYQKIARITPTGSSVNDGMFQLLDNGTVRISMAAQAARGGHTYFNTGGNVGIGVTDPAQKLTVYDSVAQDYVALFHNNVNSVDSWGIAVRAGSYTEVDSNYFFTAKDGDGDNTGYLKTSSGTFQLSDTSDIRLKENVKDTTIKGMETVNKIKVRDYNWKKNKDNVVIGGFIANELQEVYPQAVDGKPDAVDKDGKIDPMTVSRDILVPLLVKAVQELSAKVEALENA